ncbi:MAG TPA: hypothetical protein EYP10_00970, partial [Armatimonadetes bacterium]|nr:hypothetical protein [Armatimonadota bacterium]
MIRCAACGCENRDGAKFCRDCGAPLEVPSAEPSEQITAPQPEQLEATCEDVEPAEVPTVSKEDVEESPALKETVCEEAHDESVSVGEEVETQEGAPQVAVEVESPVQVEAPFTALPEGALLAERRYEVVAIVTESQECNIYEAIGTEDSRKCPQCGYLAPLDENFCAECGASLSEAEQCVGRYYILEVPRGADVWLSKLDGLYQRIADILPRWYEKFEACPYDASERSYVVLEQIDGELLSEVDVSTWSLKRVLETARTLCRLLAGLMDVGFYVPRLVEHAIVIPPEGVIFIGFHAMREYEGEVDTDVLEMVREFTAWLRNAVQPFATETAPSSEAGTAQKLFDELSEREGAIPGIAELSASLDKAMKELEAASVLSFRKAALTDVGRVRELNEDSFMTLEWEAAYESHPVRIGVYL